MVVDVGQPEEAGGKGGPCGEVSPGDSYRVIETWSRDVEVEQRGRDGAAWPFAKMEWTRTQMPWIYVVRKQGKRSKLKTWSLIRCIEERKNK
jgi:hypothetical protein